MVTPENQSGQSDDQEEPKNKKQVAAKQTITYEGKTYKLFMKSRVVHYVHEDGTKEDMQSFYFQET